MPHFQTNFHVHQQYDKDGGTVFFYIIDDKYQLSWISQNTLWRSQPEIL